ncbi:U2 snRNP auxiliary factor small subunit family protein [Populus alba x Populus x berolinensis]|nr:U2 snRNP auxiliary factor small subunit family protein [Populus alba x Populus x berolinensis]
MAEHLASIFGTEKDRVNCPFYFKIGACRHGDRCSRLHNRPTISPTLLLSNTYHRPDMITPGVDAQGQPLDPHKIQEHFEDFYEDIFEELSKFGEIENLNVCDNLADHMIGNVYVQFKEEDQAAAALQSLQGRFYSGRPIIADFSPVTDFREATCRQYEENNCNRGGYCNFMHVKLIGRDLRRKLFGRYRGYRVSRSRSRSVSPRRRDRDYDRQTETVIIVEMGGGMTETEGGKDTGVRGGAGARSGKAARKEGPGLSSGIGRGRRSSDLKREKVVLAGLGVEMYVGILLLLDSYYFWWYLFYGVNYGLLLPADTSYRQGDLGLKVVSCTTRGCDCGSWNVMVQKRRTRIIRAPAVFARMVHEQ